MSDLKVGSQPKLVLSQDPTPSDFLPTADMPVIDPEGALEQCCDWTFVVELLGDVLKEKEETVKSLQEATEKDDHVVNQYNTIQH